MEGAATAIADSLPNGCGPLLQSSRENTSTLRQDVFEFIRAHGQAARSEITNALNVSAASTTTVTADLIAAGFLKEVDGQPRESGRGRPRIALKVTPDAAYVIGIKLAFGRHTAVLTDFTGVVLANASLPSSDTRRSVEHLCRETRELVAELLKDCNLSLSDVQKVGIGLPGTIDHNAAALNWSPLLLGRNENLIAEVSEALGVGVVLDNDANMLTLAELWFGEGRRMSNFAVVTIESGVGMGLAVGNKLYRGAHGMGLELGHTKVALDGSLCKCGKRGCLEAYLADFALVRQAATVLDLDVITASNAEAVLTLLSQEARAGNPAALEIFRRAARYLALALSNVVQLFDPSTIILSGSRMQYNQLYAQDVLAEMKRFALDDGRKPCDVTFNYWDDLVWARGASALALSAVTDELIGGEAHKA